MPDAPRSRHVEAAECLSELLHIGERLELVAAGQAPARFASLQAFGHRSTKPLQPTFVAAIASGNLVAARRVVDTAVAKISTVIARQVASQLRSKTTSSLMKTRARIRCSFCGGLGLGLAGPARVAIFRACALNATDLLTESRDSASARERRRRTTKS